MEYQWNEAKCAENVSKHGVDFAEAEGFDWDAALAGPDTRRDYGEARFRAIAPIDGRLHVMAFTVRNATVRIISLRKANAREGKAYGEKNR